MLGTGIVSSCTIVSNYAVTFGGGIFDNAANNGNLENCIIYFNKCDDATYSNFYFGALAGTSYTNCCFAPALSGVVADRSTNNITTDPQFVDVAGGNYRLNKDSLCVNSGVNRDWMNGAVDYDGNARIDPFSGIVDMGCYEYLPSGMVLRGH